MTCFPSLAESTIQQYLSVISDYNFEKVAELSTWQDRDEIGPFSLDVLKDYVPLAYSRWTVDSKLGKAIPVGELEVYEMSSSPGAFGVFSIWRYSLGTGGRFEIAVDNWHSGQSLIFWGGRYFFHLKGSSHSDVVEETFRNLALALMNAIPLTNVYPVTVTHLPEERLIEESIRFYLGEASLTAHQDFPRHLISQLGFEDRIEITYARYAPAGHPLFLVGYPTPILAAQYFIGLQNTLQAHFSPQGIHIKRAGILVSIFVGPEEEAGEILARVDYSPTVKWIYEKKADLKEQRREVISFLERVRRFIIAILFYLLITLGTGVVLGLLRYLLLQCFPVVAERGKVICLKIDR